MSNLSNYYQLYINSVIKLASTLVIKSAETADGLNSYVLDYYGSGALDTLNPHSWKYYMNISGEYHPTDAEMYVVSLDTLENIKFSKEILKTHLATYDGYKYGTRQYKELVNRYPDQELLIRGILYPIDIDVAINAKDGTILIYPTELIEYNEYSLITNLQNWIYGYKERWVNKQFGISDKLYPATALGIMYLNLVPAIINFRLAACKTNEAHSFHVHQYLASHGFLNTYLDTMTIKQALFFYRNIAYIERNSGKKEIFNWLIEHVMTERSLPIAEYEMRHNLANQPDELYPTLTFNKQPINSAGSANPKTVFSLNEVLDKEDSLARDNLEYKNLDMPVIKSAMENSLHNVQETKMLESSVIDYTNSSPYNIEDILLNHWLYLSSIDKYKAYVLVTNPKTDEKLSLSAKDAYILYLYCYCKSIGIKLEHIPNMIAYRVQQTITRINNHSTIVDFDILLKLVDQKIVNKSIIEFAVSMQPNIATIISTQAFYSTCTQIYDAAQMQRRLVSTQEHFIARGMVANAIDRIYADVVCYLVDGEMLYPDWFLARTLDIEDLSRDELVLLYSDILKQSTGLAVNTTSSLKTLQKAMVNLLSQLSSYTIQFVSEINDTNIKQTDWPSVRVGTVKGNNNAVIDVPNLFVDLIHYDTNVNSALKVDLSNDNVIGTIRTKDLISEKILFDFYAKLGHPGTIIFEIMNISNIQVKPTIPLVKNSMDVIPVIGIDKYLSLTQAQQQNMKDVYNSFISEPMPGNSQEDLDQLAASRYVVDRYVTPDYTT